MMGRACSGASARWLAGVMGRRMPDCRITGFGPESPKVGGLICPRVPSALSSAIGRSTFLYRSSEMLGSRLHNPLWIPPMRFHIPPGVGGRTLKQSGHQEYPSATPSSLLMSRMRSRTRSSIVRFHFRLGEADRSAPAPRRSAGIDHCADRDRAEDSMTDRSGWLLTLKCSTRWTLVGLPLTQGPANTMSRRLLTASRWGKCLTVT